MHNSSHIKLSIYRNWVTTYHYISYISYIIYHYISSDIIHHISVHTYYIINISLSAINHYHIKPGVPRRLQTWRAGVQRTSSRVWASREAPKPVGCPACRPRDLGSEERLAAQQGRRVAVVVHSLRPIVRQHYSRQGCRSCTSVYMTLLYTVLGI